MKNPESGFIPDEARQPLHGSELRLSRRQLLKLGFVAAVTAVVGSEAQPAQAEELGGRGDGARRERTQVEASGELTDEQIDIRSKQLILEAQRELEGVRWRRYGLDVLNQWGYPTYGGDPDLGDLRVSGHISSRKLREELVEQYASYQKQCDWAHHRITTAARESAVIGTAFQVAAMRQRISVKTLYDQCSAQLVKAIQSEHFTAGSYQAGDQILSVSANSGAEYTTYYRQWTHATGKLSTVLHLQGLDIWIDFPERCGNLVITRVWIHEMELVQQIEVEGFARGAGAAEWEAEFPEYEQVPQGSFEASQRGIPGPVPVSPRISTSIGGHQNALTLSANAEANALAWQQQQQAMWQQMFNNLPIDIRIAIQNLNENGIID